MINKLKERTELNMVEQAQDMCERDKKLLLTEFGEHDADDVDEMSEDELNDAVDRAIENFHEYTEEEIRESCFYSSIDLDDEDVDLYDILSMKAEIDEEINDDSVLFPNGRDYDAEDYD